MVIKNFVFDSPDNRSEVINSRIGEVSVLVSLSGGDNTTSYVECVLNFSGTSGFYQQRAFRVSKECPVVQFVTHLNYEYVTNVEFGYLDLVGGDPVVNAQVILETAE